MRLFVPEQDTILFEVLSAYDLSPTLLGAVRYGQGHINDTFCVVCQPREGDAVRYILQGMSKAAFPHPVSLSVRCSDSSWRLCQHAAVIICPKG